jgi:hypothetical protein
MGALTGALMGALTVPGRVELGLPDPPRCPTELTWLD